MEGWWASLDLKPTVVPEESLVGPVVSAVSPESPGPDEGHSADVPLVSPHDGTDKAAGATVGTMTS